MRPFIRSTSSLIGNITHTSAPKRNALTQTGRLSTREKLSSGTKEKNAHCSPRSPAAAPHQKDARSTRTENDPTVVAFSAKMQTDETKAIYRQRIEVAEFPNAWIKEKFSLRQFHLQWIIKTSMEALWFCLT